MTIAPQSRGCAKPRRSLDQDISALSRSYGNDDHNDRARGFPGPRARKGTNDYDD